MILLVVPFTLGYTFIYFMCVFVFFFCFSPLFDLVLFWFKGGKNIPIYGVFIVLFGKKR